MLPQFCSASGWSASITNHQCHRTIPQRISHGTDYSIVKVRERKNLPFIYTVMGEAKSNPHEKIFLIRNTLLLLEGLNPLSPFTRKRGRFVGVVL